MGGKGWLFIVVGIGSWNPHSLRSAPVRKLELVTKNGDSSSTIWGYNGIYIYNPNFMGYDGKNIHWTLGGNGLVCRNVVYDLVYQINGNRTCNMDDNWQSEYDRKQYFHGNIEIWSIVDIWVVWFYVFSFLSFKPRSSGKFIHPRLGMTWETDLCPISD